MGAIEFMAVGNGIPQTPLVMGTAAAIPVLLLVVLAIAGFGILRALPKHAQAPALRLVHAEGR